MKLVVGLGNPGPEYERTRHNVGFRVVDKLASKLGWKWSERRNRAMLASGAIGLEKVVLAKPITFMNLSGQAVGELVRWYKIQPEDMLVIYDELDLPVGKVRLRARGSAAGHNGLEDIIHHLHTNAFPRLRVGIGHPANSHIKGKDYVLGIPAEDERILLEMGEDRAVEAIEVAIRQGISTTMNIVNTDPEEAARKEAERLQRQKERQEQARLKREAAQREMETNKKQFTTIDEYIKACPEDVQSILEKIRQTIRKAAPEAVETISYGMPTFNLDGKNLIYFAAWKNHIALYPIPSGTEAFKKELSQYKRTKGSVHFPFDKPIPYDLVEKIVRFRMEEDLEGYR